MGNRTSTADVSLQGPFRAHGQVDYRIEGRILRATAVGPFNAELIMALPQAISEPVAKLRRQGKWGQLLQFKYNALGSPQMLDKLQAYLQQRYTDAATNPVTALVLAPDVAGAAFMAPKFLQCYLNAGIEAQVFDNTSEAKDWIEAHISQLSTVLQWQDSYRIGHATIDEQHQELFRRASNVVAAISREGQVLCTSRLHQYLRTHLSHEEELMRVLNYPDIAAHVVQHEGLMQRLNTLSAAIAADTLDKADLESFITDWFLRHIAQEDAKLAAYVQLNSEQNKA